mgnify:FL=1
MLAASNTGFAKEVRLKIYEVVKDGQKFKMVNVIKESINPYEEMLNDEVEKELFKKKINLVDFNDLGHQPTNDRDLGDDY